MASESAGIRAWARAEGFDVPDRGRLSAEIRGAYRDRLSPLPAPGEDVDIDDAELDEAELDGEADAFGPVPVEPGPLPPIGPDPGPAPIGKGGKRKATGKPPTAAARRDIAAKVGMLVYVPGQVWAARDPVCGGTFLAQREPVTSALVNIIMDSPDLVAFFTGPAGGFMKWFELLVALQPVAVTVWAHHIAHSIEPGPERQPVDARQYAA